MNWNWNETTIDFPFSSKNLKNLLNTVCRKENRFSQYELIKWCDNLTMAFEEDEAGEFNEFDEIAFGIARDIECQWDLFLVNTYSLKELLNLDLSKVKLPQDWFIEWLEQLNEK
ncbi:MULTISPECIES: hypothetical protein [Bacillaceae]|uniref:hypothetical protein n=1 Tax=Bacillaceae TaxID=186817 RepID=UPI000C320CB2|nr:MULTISPECIES: hypothetical protein [Bacillaceae]MCT4479850.1 hypothetical protein [Peribacillus frigoritolerans]PKF85608.1 hypothetical protein CW306_26955 [Bacillus sp. BA3]